MSNKSIDNAFYNISANLIKIAVVSIVSFVITGILVREIGEELYGVVPLFNSMNRYIGLLTTVLSASVGRFVSISFFKERLSDANKYYSSSFFGLLLICSLAFVLLYAFSFILDEFFQFPSENLLEVRLFFILSVSSILIASLVSTFNVSTFIKHSFYLTDIVNVLSKIFQILFLIVVGHITLIWFGLSLFGVAVLTLVLAYFISVKLTPSLRISFSSFSKSHLKDMSEMGLNSMFNSIGILLYTSSDIIIVNILLGSIESGHYGIAVQCGMIITLVGGSITRMLAPVLVEFIAKEKRDKTISCITRFTKLITVFSAVPFVIFFVFSKPILGIWLGDGYESLFLIVMMVVSNQLLHQTTSLSFTYFNMKNKLRIPAIVTFVAGVFNILLSVVLVKYTTLGIYGVALGTFLSIFLKTVIFNVMYTSRLLKMSPFLIWNSVLKGLYWPVSFAVIFYVLFNLSLIDSVISLMLYIVLSLAFYLLVALYWPLTSADRGLIFTILKLDLLKGKIIKEKR